MHLVKIVYYSYFSSSSSINDIDTHSNNMATELATSVSMSQMANLKLVINDDDEELRVKRKARLIQLLQKAALQAVQEEDPWSNYSIHQVPA